MLKGETKGDGFKETSNMPVLNATLQFYFCLK